MPRSLAIQYLVADREIRPLRAVETNKVAYGEVPVDEPLSGSFWVELLDPDDRTLHRQVFSDPFAGTVDVCHPDGDGGYIAGTVEQDNLGLETHVLVPFDPYAVTAVFYAGPHREVGRMDISQYTGAAAFA